jgi:hypothetical protein
LLKGSKRHVVKWWLCKCRTASWRNRAERKSRQSGQNDQLAVVFIDLQR